MIRNLPHSEQRRVVAYLVDILELYAFCTVKFASFSKRSLEFLSELCVYYHDDSGLCRKLLLEVAEKIARCREALVEICRTPFCRIEYLAAWRLRPAVVGAAEDKYRVRNLSASSGLSVFAYYIGLGSCDERPVGVILAPVAYIADGCTAVAAVEEYIDAGTSLKMTPPGGVCAVDVVASFAYLVPVGVAFRNAAFKCAVGVSENDNFLWLACCAYHQSKRNKKG